MNARQRVLTALDGRAPDRVPRALGFSGANPQRLAPPGEFKDDMVDVYFVRFPASPEDQDLRRLGRPFSPETRLGTFEQVRTYTHWDYRPDVPSERNPLARARSLEDLRSFPFPDVTTPYYAEDVIRQAQELHAHGFAVGGNLPHLGGELFETAWRLRGLENLLLDLVERPDWAHFLLDRLTDMAIRNAEMLARADVDLIFLDDDVGMPGTMMISPELWRTFFKPRLAQIIQGARQVKPELRVLFHSDGYFEPILGDLIEIGTNGINPLQPEHMDAPAIRRRYGPRLVFWGTVGSQTTFAHGTPDEIRREVKVRIETLGRAGLVLSPAYDLDEPDIPWTNIAAFLEAAQAYG